MRLKRQLRIRLRRTVDARLRSSVIVPQATGHHYSNLRGNVKALLLFSKFEWFTHIIAYMQFRHLCHRHTVNKWPSQNFKPGLPEFKSHVLCTFFIVHFHFEMLNLGISATFPSRQRLQMQVWCLREESGWKYQLEII